MVHDVIHMRGVAFPAQCVTHLMHCHILIMVFTPSSFIKNQTSSVIMLITQHLIIQTWIVRIRDIIPYSVI